MFKWIGIGLGVVALITVAFIVCAYLFPDFRVATRDIAVVILAVFQMIGAILTIALLFAVLYAVRTINNLAKNTVMPKVEMLSDKIDQVIDSTRTIGNNAQTIANTASTTTGYVAEQVVAPIIRVSGLIAGARATATYLARRGAPPKE